MIRKFAAAFAVLSLAACNSQPEAPAAEETVLPDFPEPTTEGVSEVSIPAVFRGRWGLVPADCTSTQGDAKGLIVIDASTIKFYESLAMLEEVKEASETKFLAHFTFVGEGQTWKVDEQLDMREDGRLVRTEKGEGAMAGPLVYSACE